MSVFIRTIAFVSTALLVFAVLLSSCTGDGPGTTGQVSLLLKDKPSEDFDQINITVNSWQLLGDGAPVVLSDTVETFNLLDLRNSFDVVVGAVDVPVGTYTKIRLDVAQVELVKLDVDGNVIPPTIFPKLPSGKIDFVFSGPVVVAPNSTLVLKIDMDADNSIQFHPTGNDKYIFRPVVKVDVVADAADALIRLSGIVFDKQTDPDSDDAFTLCSVGAVQVTPDCTRIRVDSGTSLLDAEMLPSDYAALNDGDAVMLFGLFDASSGGVDAIRVLQQSRDGNGDLRLLALMADFSGPVVTDSAPLVTTSDSVHVPLGMALDSDLANALITNTQGTVLDQAAIDAGVAAEVFGILLPDNTAPTAIRSGFVILSPPSVP